MPQLPIGNFYHRFKIAHYQNRVNKREFIKLLENRPSLTRTDLTKVNELRKAYPYSQVLNVLSASIAHRLKSENHQELLTRAAVYSADRAILKQVILQASSQTEVLDKKTATGQKQTSRPRKTVKTASVVDRPTRSVTHLPSGHPGPLSEKDAEKLRKDVIKNLEKLLEIKAEFLQNHSGEKVKTSKRKKKLKINLSDDFLLPSEIQPLKEEPKKAPEREPKATLKVHRASREPAGDEQPEKKDDKSVVEVNSRKKEQLDIIEKFMKAQPRIKGKKNNEHDEVQIDLSRHSVEFNENLVSENLAQVMAKQGKNGKAIDIYKKLIWKFPQKKAYFASQIDSLKEK